MSFVLQLGTSETLEDNNSLVKREPMNFVVQLSTPEVQDQNVESKDQSSRENNSNVSSIVVNKSAIVYSGTQLKNQQSQQQQQQQQQNRSTVVANTSVIATVNKPTTIVYPNIKSNKESQILSITQPNVNADSTRVILQATSSLASTNPQQQNATQIITSAVPSVLTCNSKATVNNIVPVNSNQSSKPQITYEFVQSSKSQPTPAIQSNLSQKVVSTTSVKPLPSLPTSTSSSSSSNIVNNQRIQSNKNSNVNQHQSSNIQKIKTVSNVNNQSSSKNMISRVHTAPKTLPSTGVVSSTISTPLSTLAAAAAVQSASINVNQSTSNINIQKVQQNPQKAALSNQKSQVLTNAKINSNHKTPQLVDQTQSVQKVVGGASQKNISAPKQNQPQQQEQSQQQHQNHQIVSALSNNVQKNSVINVQKNIVTNVNQSQITNAQHILNSQQSKTQTTLVVNNTTMKCSPSNNIGKSTNAPNITSKMSNSTMAINKNQLVTQTTLQQHAATLLQVQHIVSQASQSAPNLQNQRVPSNPNIQPRLNVYPQNTALTSLPVNQKGSVFVNTKMSGQQPQMLLKVGPPVKNSPINPQTTVKNVSQKSSNVMKVNSQNRSANAQSVKIVQQQQQPQHHHHHHHHQQQQQQQQMMQNIVPNPQMIQKQPGCIKTIPAQKTPQKNYTQQKVVGIKTSLNTNVNMVKNQPPNNAAVSHKTSIRTLIPQQPNSNNSSQIQKNPHHQMNTQQNQVVTMSQPLLVRQSGQIKAILPVSYSREDKTDVESKIESDSGVKQEESTAPPQSPVRRMPLPYECLQFVLQDHNYGAPPPRTPPPGSPPPNSKQQPTNGTGTSSIQHQFIYNQAINNSNVADDAGSAISSDAGREVEPEGEETETAPEGEGDDEDSITRCICEFEHDDGYMICCDRCLVWQHVDCMGIDRSNIPDEYLCEICRPRRIDRQRARTLQMRKREELLNSDTSSDTSSTSSADTDVGGGNSHPPTVNTNTKKRTFQQQQQLSAASRRKSDPGQMRKLNNNNNINNNSNNNNNNNNNNNSNAGTNNNNNNVPKRQRREQHPRQASAARKKEPTKRATGKRKSNRRVSLDGDDDQDAWGSNMAPLRQWIERYEEAVTNHYSPELRARISSIKINGTHSDLKQSNMSNNVISGKCRLNIQSNSIRYLVATMYLSPNTPVVELRGKYMLSTQHRPSHPQGRQHSQRPGPFVFFYRLPREGTEVCVDTRTYGNDARFVRRSCKPNAEIKHCIEKGTLHLYIVTTSAIEKSNEITIRHEQHDLMLSPNSNISTYLPLGCACGNPKTCQINNLGQLEKNRKNTNGALNENNDGRERRRRGRRNTVCEDSDSSATNISNASTNHSTLVTTTATSIAASSVGSAKKSHPSTATPAQSNAASTPAVAAAAVVATAPVPSETVNNISIAASNTPTTVPPSAVSTATITNATTISTTIASASTTTTTATTTTTTTTTNNSTTITTTTTTTTATITNNSTTLSSSNSINHNSSSSTSNINNSSNSNQLSIIVSSSSSSVNSSGSNNSNNNNNNNQTSDISTTQMLKEDSHSASESQLNQTFNSLAHTKSTSQESKKDKKKMTREERKMEAIMKAFERMEKAEQRKHEVQARNAQRKISGSAHSDNDDIPLSHPTKPKQQHLERPIRRKKRKGRARTTSSSHSTRRTRLNSADSDLSSSEEMLPSSSLNQMCLNNRDSPFSPRHHHNIKEDNDLMPQESNNPGISTAAGLLLALANSNAPGPNSPPLQQSAPSKSPTCDSGASSSSQSSTPSTPLSSACLLVAAAVGPLAPGFKFPKTKKAMMNEWLRESPDLPQTHSQVPLVSPNTTSNLSSSSPGNQPGRSIDFLSPSDPSPEFLTQSYAAKSLATLVQAANSVSGICDSPPQRKQSTESISSTCSVAAAAASGCPVSSGSAKKRWLRQAISEECDSPNSRPESPPNEIVAAPPKKRRIARESISSDNYTPPTTPTHTISDSMPVNSILSSTDNDYSEHPQSPYSMEQIKNEDYIEQMKEETNSESEKPEYSDDKIINVKVENDCNKVENFRNNETIEDKISLSNIIKNELTEKTQAEVEVAAVINSIASIVTAEAAAAAAARRPMIMCNSMSNHIKNELIDTSSQDTSDDCSNSNSLKKELNVFENETNEVSTEINIKININNSVSEFHSEMRQPDEQLAFHSDNALDMSENETDKHLNQDKSQLDNTVVVVDGSGGGGGGGSSGGGGGGVGDDEEDEDDEDDDDEVDDDDDDDDLFNLNDVSDVNVVIVNSDKHSEDCMSIDEFDVEAQMKKITGDDGNDYKQKFINCDKDKSMDGIEGLMDSSKEDSESEDPDFDDLKSNNESQSMIDEFHQQSHSEVGERPFKYLDLSLTNSTKQISDNNDDNHVETKEQTLILNHNSPKNSPNHCTESEKVAAVVEEKLSNLIEQVGSLEESAIESTDNNNIKFESPEEPSKIFHSIPPLSERIRKKTNDNNTAKKLLDFDAALNDLKNSLDCNELSNGDDKSQLSPALRELLETKIDEGPPPLDSSEKIVEESINPVASVDYVDPIISEQLRIQQIMWNTKKDEVSQTSLAAAIVVKEEKMPVILTTQPEIKRLKDPRTRSTPPKQEPAPVKRKVRTLSISEYRKRKQQSSGTSPHPEPSNENSSPEKSPSARMRSNSASSGTSSLSSEEDNTKTAHDLPGLTTLPSFNSGENEERKVGEEGTIGWSAAPTLVERQRENLTERLKREFGLFLSDDEEERARKQGLTAEAILKARKEAGFSQAGIAGSTAAFPASQLPPQSYIPPPGSAPLHYSQFQSKQTLLGGQYQNFTIPQSVSSPVYSGSTLTGASGSPAIGKQTSQQFLVPQAPQAPPGSNPYPPQFVTATSLSPSTTPRYPPSTPPSGFSSSSSSSQSQSSFFNHPHSTPRS